MYPDGTRSRFQQAAYRLRLPYWDWAKAPPAGEDTLPPFMGDNPQMDANGPFGVQKIANPFFQYSFHPLDGAAFGGVYPVSSGLAANETPVVDGN